MYRYVSGQSVSFSKLRRSIVFVDKPL